MVRPEETAVVGNFRIRPYQPADEAASYLVCLKTGDSGKDGTHLFPDDPRALGNIYVGPYLAYEPDLAFVLEDALGVCGYVLGARDSKAFYHRYLNEWVPQLQRSHPEPGGDSSLWTPTQRLYYEYHHPVVHLPDAVGPYPGHMHIDLMPRAQGHGCGKVMVRILLEKLKASGCRGVHLIMSVFNDRALHFYLKLGFKEIARAGEGQDAVIIMALQL